MRHALLIAFAAFALVACGDDDSDDHDHVHDSGPTQDAGPSPDAGPAPDAGPLPDAGPPSSKLERPGLPRPPSSGLPDDLRPPR